MAVRSPDPVAAFLHVEYNGGGLVLTGEQVVEGPDIITAAIHGGQTGYGGDAAAGDGGRVGVVDDVIIEPRKTSLRTSLGLKVEVCLKVMVMVWVWHLCKMAPRPAMATAMAGEPMVTGVVSWITPSWRQLEPGFPPMLKLDQE